MSSTKILIGSLSAFICVAGVAPAAAQTGLYLRGDLGWAGATNANIHDRNFPLDHAITGPNGAAGTLSDIGSGWLIGGGVGFQWFQNLRGDIVYTYRGDYHLDQVDDNNPATLFKSDIHAHAVMASAYWDFPIDDSVAAFVGFGLGWSEVNFGKLSATSTLTINPLAATPATGTIATAPGGSTDNFAWQIMAGLSFPVETGITIDLFYRYFDAGHFASSAGNVTINGNVVGTYAGAEGALHSHEIAVSVRFATSL
jgi:opacity protein-like surface antigen